MLVQPIKELWEKLLVVLDAEKLLSEKNSSPNRRRKLIGAGGVANGFFGREKTEVWIEKLESFAGIPAGPVLNIEEMSLDPQTIARRMVREVSNHEGCTQVIGHRLNIPFMILK